MVHSGCTNVHIQPHRMSATSMWHPLQAWLFVDFLIMAIWRGVRWYLQVFWIGVSLLISGGDQFFMCWEPSLSGLGQCLFRSFAHFSFGLVFSFCCWGVSGVGWSFWNHRLTWLWDLVKWLRGFTWKVNKRWYLGELLCSSMCIFSQEVSWSCPFLSMWASFVLSLHVVGRSDVKAGELNEGW